MSAIAVARSQIITLLQAETGASERLEFVAVNYDRPDTFGDMQATGAATGVWDAVYLLDIERAAIDPIGLSGNTATSLFVEETVTHTLAVSCLRADATLAATNTAAARIAAQVLAILSADKHLGLNSAAITAAGLRSLIARPVGADLLEGAVDLGGTVGGHAAGYRIDIEVAAQFDTVELADALL